MGLPNYRTWIADPSPQPFHAEVIHFRSGAEIENAISSPPFRPERIFIDVRLSVPGPVDIVKKLRKAFPTTPLYFLYDGSSPLEQMEAQRLGLSGLVKKSQGWFEVMLEKLQLKNAPAEEPAPYSRPFIPTQLVSVPIMDLVHIERSHFDLYMKLPSGKFAVVQEAMQPIALKRLLGYAKAGAKELYLNPDALQKSQDYAELFSKNILESTSTSFEFKFFETLRFGEKVWIEIVDEGLSPQSYEKSLEFISQTQYLVRKLALSNPIECQESFLKFFMDSHLYEHATSSVLICSLIAAASQISSQNLWDEICISAFFHDIGLIGMPDSVKALDGKGSGGINSDLWDQYIKHPEESVKLLSGMGGFPDLVNQIIRQHHARKDSAGFPGINPAEIHPVAEMIGLSDELLWKMKEFSISRKMSKPFYSAAQLIIKDRSQAFSGGLMDALRRIVTRLHLQP